MDNNSLLMIMLAFVVGYCLPSMMKNMCGGRLVEGKIVPRGKYTGPDWKEGEESLSGLGHKFGSAWDWGVHGIDILGNSTVG